MPIYKFIVDHAIQEEITKAMENLNLDLEMNKTKFRFVIKYNGERDDEIFKINNILKKFHQIEDFGEIDIHSESLIPIWMNQLISTKTFYVDYVFTSELMKILKNNGVYFSLVDIKAGAFLTVDSLPIWIEKKDLEKTRKIFSGSIFGHPFIENLNKYQINTH